MPGKDKTGPLGQGPKTGRGLGLCNDSNENNSTAKTRLGRGLGPCGAGLAQRRGWRRKNRRIR